MARLDVPAVALASVSVVAAGFSAVLAPDEVQPLLIPVLFVLAGALGPLWDGARFTCRSLIGLGGAHLIAFALTVLALHSAADAADPASRLLHALSLLLYVAGFAVLVPLAAGFPGGPAPRWSRILALIACVVPLAAVLSGPTPTVLRGAGFPAEVGPIATVLPPVIASLAAVVFALPVLAVVIAIVRAVRGGRELRGRLVLALATLGVLAATVLVGVVLAHGPLSTAVFLVTSPLVPAALVVGSRPVATAPDPVRSAAMSAMGGLPQLTPREREVLALMAEGQSNPAIGRSLHISLSAVEKHATAIFVKLGLVPEADTHRRVAAVVAYLRSIRA